MTTWANHSRSIKYAVALLFAYALSYTLLPYFVGDVEDVPKQNASVERYNTPVNVPAIGFSENVKLDEESAKGDVPVYEYPRTDDSGEREESQVNVTTTSTTTIQPTIDTHAYIINTYYYPRSRSFGKDALAMVLLLNRNTMADIIKYNMTFEASNGNDSVVVVPKITKEVYDSCTYINVLAKGTVLPGMTKLEIVDGATRMEIPFRRPRETAPAPVIICITPQFLSEQWQLFVIQAHVVRLFGGHIHLSVISMIDTFFQLVKEYEKQGYVTVDHWVRPKFATAPEAPEPNANMEWRNIGGGYTECLLQYKEAAAFITFFDLDDILFPNGFDSYYGEFSSLSFANPTIRSFHYSKREYMIYRESQLDEINFNEMFGHSWYAPQEFVGKTVAKPENVDSMWIHRSFNIQDKDRLYLKNNFISHLQKPKERNGTELSIMKVDFVEMKELQRNEQQLTSLQQDFERMMNSSGIKAIADNLQKDNFYLPLMYKCYHDRFYKLYNQSYIVQTKICGNNEGCEIPQREDLKCVHTDADYISGPRMSPITFHYHINSRFARNVDCSQ